MGALFKKYIWVVSLFCVVVTSYFLAKITTLIIAGYFPNVVITAASSDTKVAIQKHTEGKINVDLIINRNIFNPNETSQSSTEEIEENSTEENQEISLDKAVETKLNIKLISTVSVGDGKNRYSSCVIESNRKMDTYYVNDKKVFSPNTKIVQILPKRVEFINNNQLEYVKIEDFADGKNLTNKPNNKFTPMEPRIAQGNENETPEESIVREGNKFEIARSEVNAALANINKLATDIRAIPYFEGGVAKGFKIHSIRRGSLFDKLGIKRGDILMSVNGKTLDMQSGFETFNTLKNETEFQLEIKRQDEVLEYSYEII